MQNNRHNFTKEYLNGLEPAPAGKRYVVYDRIRPELAIRITDKGVKSFIMHQKHHGRMLRITLGRYPKKSIDKARKEAIKHLNGLEDGNNPNEAKRKFNEEYTLGELFNDFMIRYSQRAKKSWMHDQREVPRFLSHWFGRKISEILRYEIQSLFDKISRENGIYAANRLLERLRAMYNKAIEWGWEGQNPSNGIKKNREIKRDRFLLAHEIPNFCKAVNAEEPTARDYIWLSLLTGARKNNVLAMRWDEIDFESALWRIPDTKNGEPVIVPLITRALEILHDRYSQRKSEWVFESPTKPGTYFADPKRAWCRILERAGIQNLRIHDIRRTLGSWQAMTGASLPIIGKSLGHKSSASTNIYARLQTDPVRDSIQTAVDKMLEYQS
jgi:integrase